MRSLVSIRLTFLSLRQSLNERNKDLKELLEDLTVLFGRDQLISKIEEQR